MLAKVRSALRSYHNSLSQDGRRLLERFRLVQMLRKVVGVGSVGTRAWVLLLLGRDTGDPLILQMKEAQPSVLEAFAGRSNYANAGQRVVVGKRVMQANGDILLSWQRFAGFDDKPRDFYVRQLRDWKGSIEIEQLNPAGIITYGRLCGWTLARAHARSGDRIAIAAYLGTGTRFDQAIADFAVTYADQNVRGLGPLAARAPPGRRGVPPLGLLSPPPGPGGHGPPWERWPGSIVSIDSCSSRVVASIRLPRLDRPD